ncbi:MAG TPA: ribokinase [Rhizomicrobium sp.]|nr:ribokinase [Rhizomicrobium sp.]
MPQVSGRISSQLRQERGFSFLMREQARILVVGSANMDLVAYCDRLPRRGETLLGGAFATFPGGKGANQAVAAARAGGKVAFLGRVGADDFGVRLRAGLAADGVDTRWLASAECPSGVAVILAGGGDNMIVVAPGANSTLDSTALAAEAFAGASLVLCQLEIPLDGVIAAARCAHEAGAAFMLDPAPARALPRHLLEKVDWLAPNESEACALLGCDALGDPLDAAGALAALGPRGVVLKRGAKGVVLAGADKMPVVIPAPAVGVADTIAAGDAFAGAFAVALGEGLPPAQAARFATVAASLSVTRSGAQPSLARRTEIDAAVRRYDQVFPA